MSPDGGDKPVGELAAAIDEFFGNFDASRPTSAPTPCPSRLGLVDPDLRRAGQAAVHRAAVRPPGNLPAGQIPLLMLDMWEHAFYLQYTSDKASYVKTGGTSSTGRCSGPVRACPHPDQRLIIP